MTLSVSTLQVEPRNISFSTTGFRNIIENHLQWLIASDSTTMKEVDAHHLVKYRGDFYGMLLAMDLPVDIHWIILRMNGLTSTLDFNGGMSAILVPSLRDLNVLLGRYKNTQSTV